MPSRHVKLLRDAEPEQQVVFWTSDQYPGYRYSLTPGAERLPPAGLPRGSVYAEWYQSWITEPVAVLPRDLAVPIAEELERLADLRREQEKALWDRLTEALRPVKRFLDAHDAWQRR